ncbi:uncharacterized protein LOC130731518 isoform X2 [Lotus japonicus]|uniref:uncharacterized protein LOC130731518 isoform X2 n=1 Tax=Lotus japonicus TaxID=34305 RepID=UPI002583015F|nr:uncharacterized protein LOC130731518 isoform X2 [Lotus japonicus]
MANLPQSLSVCSGGAAVVVKDQKTAAAERIILKLILELSNPDNRERALHELAQVVTTSKRELVQDLELAPLIWHSFGTIAVLLQEIVAVYPVLSPPNLSPTQSNRVCNALALLQCVAAHHDTRRLFLNAHLPLYLYPFLKSTSKSKPFEYLRLTSLGVIGALVKVDDGDIISFLLSTEIIPLCLRTMEIGTELSKTVSTFIIQRVLSHDVGKGYIFTRTDRFCAISQVLGEVVAFLAEQPSPRLFKHVIRCYLLLSENWSGGEALRRYFPEIFRDGTFNSWLQDQDQSLMLGLHHLLHKVNQLPSQQAGGGFNHMMAP